MVWKSQSIRFGIAKGRMQGVQTCIKHIPRESPGSLPRGPLTFSIPAPSGLLGVKKSALGNLEKPSRRTRHSGTYGTFSPQISRICLRESEWCAKALWSASTNPSIVNNTLPKPKWKKQNKKHMVKRNYGSDNSEEQSVTYIWLQRYMHTGYLHACCAHEPSSKECCPRHIEFACAMCLIWVHMSSAATQQAGCWGHHQGQPYVGLKAVFAYELIRPPTRMLQIQCDNQTYQILSQGSTRARWTQYGTGSCYQPPEEIKPAFNHTHGIGRPQSALSFWVGFLSNSSIPI